MAELKPLKGGYYVWKYVPSIPISVISLLLWLAIGGALSWRMWKTRTWFCTSLVIGAFSELMVLFYENSLNTHGQMKAIVIELTFEVVEAIGYAARASAANKTDKLMPYIIQNIFILLPPVLFAATIYMCLGRLVCLLRAENYSLIRPSRLTKTFVGFDILSFVVQGNSAPFSALADRNPIFPKLGQALVLVGLVIQLVAFSIFFIFTIKFHRRIKASPTRRSLEVDQSWHKIVYMLYVTSVLIILRSIFRVVEFAAGQDGYLLGNEWPLYVFDTVPMFAVCILFYVWYPACLTGVKSKGTFETNVELSSQVSGEHFIIGRGGKSPERR